MRDIPRSLLATILLLLSITPPSASAFIDPPQILPAQPSADFPVSLSIRTGVCDTFLTTGPDDREVQVSGNRVVVRIVGVSTSDFAQCIFSVGTRTYRIGMFAAGNYELEVYLRDVFVSNQLTLVGTASFSVARGIAVTIPASGKAALGLMVLGLCVLSAGALRRPSA